MKNLLGAVFILFFIVGVKAQGDSNNQSTLIWDSSRKLQWTDFKGHVDPNKFGSAMTSHKIEIKPTNVMVDENDNIQGYQKMTVEAQFFMNKSWTATSSQHILSHEQLHFDIAELYARKIRQRFEEFKTNGIASFSKYQECYNLFWKESRNVQKRYDEETKHGQNKLKNKNWAIKIARQLDELKEFE
jgi:hypothetical protein